MVLEGSFDLVNWYIPLMASQLIMKICPYHCSLVPILFYGDSKASTATSDSEALEIPHVQHGKVDGWPASLVLWALAPGIYFHVMSS